MLKKTVAEAFEKQRDQDTFEGDVNCNDAATIQEDGVNLNVKNR